MGLGRVPYAPLQKVFLIFAFKTTDFGGVAGNSQWRVFGVDGVRYGEGVSRLPGYGFGECAVYSLPLQIFKYDFSLSK